MRRYEAMFILKSDLGEEKKKMLFSQIAEVISKNNGRIVSCDIWAQKRRLCYAIKKQSEGLYYLVTFDSDPQAISKLKQGYRLTEDILRVMITLIN
jgi:small subunit ribosomal protein S6